MDNPSVRFDLPLCAGDDGKFYFGRGSTKLWLATQRLLDMVDRIDVLIKHTAPLRSSLSPNFMTPKQSAKLAETFRTFDKDASGFLEVEELRRVLGSTGRRYSCMQLQELVENITGSKDSAGLTFEQFADVLRVDLTPTLQDRAPQRFGIFDVD